MKAMKASGIPNLVEALEFQRETSRVFVKVMGIFGMMIFAVAMVIVFIVFRREPAGVLNTAIISAAAGLLALGGIFSFVVYRLPAQQTRRAYAEGMPPYQQMELEIDDDEIRVTGPTANYTMKWEYFVSRSQGEHTIVLLGQNNDGVYAGRSMFASDADWEMFNLKARNRVTPSSSQRPVA